MRDRPKANDDGTLTLDNKSVQRLMEYGLLHHTEDGWFVGTFKDAATKSGTRL